MEFTKLNINDLLPANYNPRKNLNSNDKEYTKIKQSIEAFGYVDPIIINSDHTVIGGHQRLKVLKELGYEEIDVIKVDLNKSKEKALNVALNKIQGDWDFSKLSLVLQDLEEVTVTGFEQWELNNILGDLGEKFNPADEWVGMPEYESKNLLGVKQIIIHFKTEDDVKSFSELLQQTITDKTKYLWYPKMEVGSRTNKIYE